MDSIQDVTVCWGGVNGHRRGSKERLEPGTLFVMPNKVPKGSLFIYRGGGTNRNIRANGKHQVVTVVCLFALFLNRPRRCRQVSWSQIQAQSIMWFMA